MPAGDRLSVGIWRHLGCIDDIYPYRRRGRGLAGGGGGGTLFMCLSSTRYGGDVGLNGEKRVEPTSFYCKTCVSQTHTSLLCNAPCTKSL